MAKKPTDEEFRQREIRRILEQVNRGIPISEAYSGHYTGLSKEFETFVREEKFREKPTLWERAARAAERLGVEPDAETARKMRVSIEFAHLDATPTGSVSLAFVVGIALMLFSLVGILLQIVSMTTGLIGLSVGLIAFYYLYNYPYTAEKVFRVQASSEIVLAVIYMVIYMRASPNLEGAVRFAALNLSGPLAYDFRKMLWDVESGKYSTMEGALEEYLRQWKTNTEFIESVDLIRNSMEQPESRRHNVLDEAVNTVLAGTKERMSHYAQSLLMPVALIHTMGIILPILVLVMFPVIVLFLGKTVNPWLLVLGYDVFLPLLIYYLTMNVLQSRPVGFSVPDVSLHPKFTPLGTIKIGDAVRPLWPLGVGLSILGGGLGIILLAPKAFEVSFDAMLTSMIITWGLAIGPIVYFLLDSGRMIKLREDIKSIQAEFGEALFRLGNVLSLGMPLEAAIEETARKSPDLSVSDLFRKVLTNVRQGRMSFDAAFFDKELGAIWAYPSKLIINIMRIILEATKKGVHIAANSALSISRYIRQVQNIEDELRGMLSETTTSMKFMSLFLGPMIAGVTVTMAGIMMLIFKQIGASLGGLESASIPGFSGLLIGGWGTNSASIPIAIFQLVVGIYVIEVTYLLSYLSVGVESGPNDKVLIENTAGQGMIVSLIVYTLSLLITWSIFGTAISSLLIG